MVVFKAHSNTICALEFAPDGRSLVTSSGSDEGVRLWSGEPLAMVREWPSSGYSRISISPDGQFIAVGGHGVKVWLVGGVEGPLLESLQFAQALKFSPEGRRLAAHGHLSGTLELWSVPEFERLEVDWVGNGAYFRGGMAFHPDGKLMALDIGVEGGDPSRRSFVDLRNTSTWEQSGILPTKSRLYPETSLSFSPDGSMLAGTFCTFLNVWNLTNRVEVASHKVGTKHFKGLAFTPDGQRLLTVSNDETVRVWETSDWSVSGEFAWKIGKLGAVAIPPDGCRFAAGGSTGKVVIWDAD